MADTKMLTKQDLIDILASFQQELKKDFATKDDLKKFATKDDLLIFATKDDIKNLSSELSQAVQSIVEILDEHDTKFIKKSDFIQLFK